MRKMLFIMQGAPGSGKTTVANGLASYHCSTDDYWMRNGIYEFDGSKLSEAHELNQEVAESLMKIGKHEIVIDNTNIKYKDAQVYFALAEKYGYGVQVVRVDPGLETCLMRNAARSEDRRIPEDVVRRMHGSMEDLWRCHSEFLTQNSNPS